MIFPAVISDTQQLSEIAYQSKAYWKYTESQLESWREDLTVTSYMIKTMFVFKFIESGKPLGFYILNQPKQLNIELEFLFVSPEAIGKGIGKKLLHHSFLKAQEFKCKSITVLSDPNAIDFYNSQGFLQIEKKESSVKGRFLSVMKKKLIS